MEMRQVIIEGCGRQFPLLIDEGGAISSNELCQRISKELSLPIFSFYASTFGGLMNIDGLEEDFLLELEDLDTVLVNLRVVGGIDFQHREGSKIGSGGQLSESQKALERKERLRKLALETIDITKDPYFMKNHLGTFECKLCLTLHPNEGNYLAHTQGKRHQSNLGRRAAMEAKTTAPMITAPKEIVKKRVIRIGRPGYKVTKSRDLQTHQKCLCFEIDYPEAEEGMQPRHRFMSAYEQKVEQPDRNYQYLLFACDPYETIGFKIPSKPIDKSEGRFFTNWDEKGKRFVLKLYFATDE